MQNGTAVRFATNLGRVDPAEAQTRNGMAITTFHAGDVSGIADVRATSGAAGGTASTGTGNGTTTTATSTNVVQITIGAAAVESVTLRANPAFVPPRGGTVELVASVLSVTGQALSGVPVTFTTTEEH